MSQNKYYFTAEKKAEHEMEVGMSWHRERRRALNAEKMRKHFESGGSQCPHCEALFVPDDTDKLIAQLRQEIKELRGDKV